MSWTPPAMQRHEALSDLMTRMGLDYAAEQRTEVPPAFTLEGQTIPVDPWERAVLQASLSRGPQAPAWAPLLAESLALQMKCQARSLSAVGAPHAPATGNGHSAEAGNGRAGTNEKDRTNGEHGGNETHDVEELIVDTAVGLALLHEMQRVIDQLVVGGEMADAKKLTASRNRIVQLVARLKEQLGEENFTRASNKCEGMVTEAHQAPLVSRSTGPDPGRSQGTWKPKAAAATGAVVVQTAAPAEESTSLVKACGVLLAVLLVVWSVLILPRMLEKPPPPLQPTDFGSVPGLSTVVARPPAAYLTVDAATWDGMSRPERKQHLVTIGKIADEAGYVGVDLRDGNGRVIGRWLKASGATLSERD